MEGVPGLLELPLEFPAGVAGAPLPAEVWLVKAIGLTVASIGSHRKYRSAKNLEISIKNKTENAVFTISKYDGPRLKS